MNLEISTHSAIESERIVLFLTMALAISIEKEAIGIEEAENLLFSPYTQKKLKEIGVEDDIIQIINLGCELENVQSIIPQALTESVNEIFQLSLNKLRSLPNVEIPTKKWIN